MIGEATFLGAHFEIDITNWRAIVDETRQRSLPAAVLVKGEEE